MLALTIGLVLAAAANVQMLDRPGGQVAYEVIGSSGPIVLCAPGIGDVRAQYRFLAPALVAAGYRVVLMDLRGLGDSTTGFASYSSDAVGDDMVALLGELGAERATIIGNSASAASAVWAAATVPDVANIVLIGPFVRQMQPAWYQRALLNVAFRGFWGRPAWMAYYSSLYPSHKPDDFDTYKAALSHSLDGRMQVVNAMLSASKAASEAKLGDVKARVLVVMGSRDPDFPDPADEALRVAKRLDGGVLMVEGAGHYPHAEMPEKTAPPIVAFLQHETGQHGATDGH
jgi:pimeloyl-ACP methyl ester carboxylesterase